MLLVGTGLFTWPRNERVSDRYGLFFLEDAAGVGARKLEHLPGLLGKRCEVIAVVRETRESHHVGDFFRGFTPSTPKVSESISLGVGELVSMLMDQGWGMAIGLRPEDGRAADWIDPRKLYRIHDQTVDLFIGVTTKPFSKRPRR